MIFKKKVVRKIGFAVVFVAVGLWGTTACPAGVKSAGPKVLPVNRPQQITAETDPVLSAAVSDDGKWLVYTSQRADSTDLWLRSADPAVVVLPERLTADPFRESSPAFAPDGRWIAYTGTAADVKGDIYLLDLQSRQAEAVRLTGDETEDGGPCFAPDGHTLYFHQKNSGDEFRRLVSLDLGSKDRRPVPLDAGGGGAFPAVAPNGQKLAFVTYRDDAAGDIYLLDLKDNSIRPLTRGPYMDWQPEWSPDGQYIYFARIAVDTDRDGRLTKNDKPSIYRVNVNSPKFRPYPLTLYTVSAFQPQVAGTRLFFLSDKGGVNNCWSTPVDGVIPAKDSPEKQMELAESLAVKIPPEPYLTLLAYYKVLERYEGLNLFGARAAFQIGSIYQDLEMPDLAAVAFGVVIKDYSSIQPEAPQARIELSVIQTKKQLQFETDKFRRNQILTEGLAELGRIAGDKSPAIRARAAIEQARLLFRTSQDPAALLKAVGLLEEVIDRSFAPRSMAAEALILKAEIYSQIGMSADVYPLYMSVIETYPDVSVWADKAVERVLDLTMETIKTKKIDAQIEHLRSFADSNRSANPLLTMGALNRIGDLLFSRGEWSGAKALYYQILDQFRILNTQTSAARLSLAEILYREERFRQALDLYETEIALRPYEDHISSLARAGYIRKSIASGEFLYRLGEILSATKTFKELIDYNDLIVEAHRGYIKCAAATNTLPTVLDKYRARLKKDPDNPIVMYATALCLTYLNQKKPLEEAQRLILRAINIDGRSEYFHQTLGYIFEVLETVYNEKGTLEMALEAYKKAYFLNDHQNNPANAANLALNLGNTYYLLGQYPKAFAYYTRRLEAEMPFDNTNTEILFYRRLGASAFQAREAQQTIAAFTKTLELIDRHMEPQQASDAFDRISRYVMDRIVAPGLRLPATNNPFKVVADIQSNINRRLSKLNYGQVLPPPAPGWKTYRQGITALLQQQEKLNHKIVALLGKQNQTGLPAAEVRQSLTNRVRKVDEALSFPERLVRMKAEMLDRLGLAYQEAGDYERAMQTFEQVYALNKDLVDQGLGMPANLGRNKRSAAYNAYLFAGTLSGEQRRKLLKRTAEDFVEVIDLVKTFGVPSKKRQKGQGLVTITAQVAVDDIGATQAGYGFSAKQEIRLAETFLPRIHLELGQLLPAERAIKKQLAEYPSDKPVSDKNIYGVALLYHRAGQLAAARGKLTEAFEYFRYSAGLSLRMQNPVSTAVNVTNMAGQLAMMSCETSAIMGRASQLEVLDTQASRLLAENPFAGGQPLAAGYHNQMGVYFASFCDSDERNLESAAWRARVLQKAAIHFESGLRLLDQEKRLHDREMLALLGVLHLNMARVALEFEAGKSAREHFEAALKHSRRGMLPELQWRALAGLGRLKAALDVLDSVTLLRAGCGPGEITKVFGKLVADLVAEGKIQDAFDLAERLSELERFNRLAPLFGELQQQGRDSSSRALFKKIYPRLERIRILRSEIVRSTGEAQQYLLEELNRERRMVEDKLGPEKQTLPDMVRLLQDDQTRETVLILLGLAVHAEETATLMAATTADDRFKELSKEYRNLVNRYQQIRQQAVLTRPEETAADIFTFLGPEPCTAADVREHLPAGGKLVRLFAADDQKPGYIVFTLTPQTIDVAKDVSKTDFRTSLMSLDEGFVYVGYDNPAEILADIPENLPALFALSGSHLVRCIKNRKPFKRSLLAVGALDTDIEGYEVSVLQEGSQREIAAAVRKTNILLIRDEISLIADVPTKTGEYARRFLAVKSPNPAGDVQTQTEKQHPQSVDGADLTANDYRISVQRLLADAPNLTLALLPGASFDDVYLIGHMFSIYGCPAIILPQKPARESEFINRFLAAYPLAAAQEALKKAVSLSDSRKHWIQLGFRGMTAKEAEAFAGQYFEHYVYEGQQAFEKNDATRALLMFENAIQIAQNVAELHPYLPALYNFGRESALMDGQKQKAVAYGRAVVDLLAAADPGSEQHARALLMLGSVHAQFEQYEKSVPYIEQAVKMMANLQLGPDQIEALAGLSVVLANATQYDRALTHLQSAVSLSRALNQKELLAGLYVNIGGIYDRGLNQYALAMQNYNKALSIYRETEMTAAKARILLSIGRCHRLMGNFIEARSFCQQALKLIASDADNIHLKAQIIFEQANLSWFQGEYETAFKLQRTCYTLARAHGWPLMQTLSLNTSGLIWWTLGNNRKALSELEKALAYGRDLQVPDDEIANIHHNEGLVYREMGRYQEALSAFDRALDIDTRLKSKWAVAYDLRNKALTLLRMGQSEASIPLLERAASEAQSIGNRVNEIKALLGLGDAHLAIGNHGEAEKFYHGVLSLAKSMALPETEWRSLFGLAKLRLAAGQKEAAEKFLFEAIAIIERLRADIKIDLLKESFVNNKLDVYETLVRLLADMGKVTESFEMAERSRARNFIDLLGNQRLSLGNTLAQQLYERQALIRSKIQAHETLLAQSMEEADRKLYKAALEQLNNDYNDTMLDIQAQNPQLSSMIAVEPLKTDKLLQILAEDVALLAYYILPDEIFCWVIRPQGIKLRRTSIGKSTVGRTILEYRRMIQNIEPLEDQSKELFNWLLAPVSNDLAGVKTLGIIPHGPLHYLSFATLADDTSYLIDRYALFYLPSASVLDYTLSKRRAAKNLNVLAIGNPDLGDPVFELPFAEYEVDSIRWNFPRIAIMTGDKATESWIVKNIEKFGIIHLASHGEFNPVNPLFSAIKLSKGEDTDGDLAAAEIFGLKINADVVVLSACQTGLGKVTDGDDVIGLNRAFFYAGTHTIVSSLWRVSDIATAVLIKQFYRRYVSDTKADSLRAAILHVKQRYPHPSYWGAFTLVGDYQ